VAKDSVTAYAERVAAGEEIASYLVKLACARHLRDLKQQKAKGLEWRPDAAQEVIDFFAEVLVLPENTDADDTQPISHEDDVPRPFVLSPFQAFIAGSLFGWYTAKGYRRFHQAYVETAKGSGKTPLGAGLMLYMLVADGEQGAQVYAAAVGKDQAKLAFTDAERMVNASPYLSDMIDQKVNNLAVLESGSFFRPISSEKRGLDGKRVHGALIDELHEHPTPVVVNKMRKGIKGRRNALILEITNSGFDRTSVCWNHHEYSRKVLEGTVQNEEWFAFVCGLDPCDACRLQGKWFPSEDCEQCDDWRTEGPHWLKANPNLGVSLPWDYVRNVVNQAKGMPSEVSDTLRFTFCVWTQAAVRAIDMGAWAACRPMPKESELIGAECYGSFDLGETDDFSAWARLWILSDGRVAVKMRYWLPDAALKRYPNRPYDEWRRAGILTVTPGDVTDYNTVREQIYQDYKRDGIRSICYDTKTARETAQILGERGVDVIPLTQGFPLNEAIKRTLSLIVEGNLCHGNEVILSWMASNLVVLTNSSSERKIDKQRSAEKIDGMAAVIMGIEGAVVRRPKAPEYFVGVYGGRG
jgi:phage terminase large subunit-like protein